jgi:Uma2 family endonuclease
MVARGNGARHPAESEKTMATATHRRRVTAEEFEQYPSDCRLDLIEGELVPMPPMPGEQHGAVAFDVSYELAHYVKEHKLGRCFAAETRFIIRRNPDTAIAPDWAFISHERLPERLRTGFSDIVPDAILEVRSPGDRPAEVAQKMRRWVDAGVRLAWELNPATQTLTIYRQGTEPRTVGFDGSFEGEDVLPGFSLPLRDVLDVNMDG